MVSVRQCVLVDSTGGEGGALTFAATDGQIDIVVEAKGEVKRSGKAALNHHGLESKVAQLPEGYVEITIDQKLKVSIRSSSSKRKFQMTALDPADFPSVVSTVTPAALYSIEAKILQQTASEVAFGIDGKGNEMPAGALLTPAEDKFFRLASVNRYALALATGWFTERSSSEDCLLPLNLLEALKAIPKEATLSISKDETKIFVTAPGVRIRASQLQRPFPPVWKQCAIGVPEKKRFRVSGEVLLESVRAVSVASALVEGAENFVQIDLSCKEGVVTVSTRQSDWSQGEDEVSVSDAAAGSFLLHVDAAHLSAALKSFGTTEVDLYFDVVFGQEALYLRSETLLAMLTLMTVVQAPPGKEKK